MSHLANSEVNATNVNSKFIRNICSKIDVTSPVGCCRVNKAVIFIGYTVLAFILGFLIVPILFCICGFRPIGVREDSYAAHFQSLHGTPKPFSCLQSLSMTGILAPIIAIAGMVLAAVKVLYFDKKCS